MTETELKELIDSGEIAIDTEVEQHPIEDNGLNENTLILDIDNVSDIKLNRASFVKGVNKVSELCGMISALCSVGITPSSALNYIMDKEGTVKLGEINTEIAKINADSSVDSAKFGMANLQKNLY